ncbi:GNAT family N-acetyltransferase [Noviherbaspirillum sp. Root189]|uniref:GNAT family N-acetyltransferase n=1 Tax=Noviherbaspirillum sp. Root189 TaxID=1736487 RepID=UPI00070ABE6D|nr:GNAT family N-acetyltransferase [Noviherbaspirillum sp. Root189]KRB81051.1 hypothetical protein ASE07_24915 [Noviherbaspirillum sp. Root189]
MRIRWNASDPAPELIGHFDEFAIFLEGRRLFSRRTQALVWANIKRFADVIGPGHDAVNKAGWHYTPTAPFCFTASSHGQLVAAAWATHIRAESGKHGCNLAYALLSDVEGRGLAKLLAALAFHALFNEIPKIGFVNIQSQASNERSTILARSFGMQLVPEEGFDAVQPGSDAVTSYCTYRIGAQAFASTVKLVLAQRLRSHGNDHGVKESARNQAEPT